jgi:hypothetical protein
MKYTELLGAKTKGTNICIKNDLAGRSEPGHLLHQVGCKGKNVGHGCIWPEFFSLVETKPLLQKIGTATMHMAGTLLLKFFNLTKMPPHATPELPGTMY